MTKYRAKPLYYCHQAQKFIEPKQVKQLNKSEQKSLTYFASRHEFDVYKVLFETGLRSKIELQPKVEIIPPKVTTCYPSGKYWKADFMARIDSKPVMLVEAKGVVTKDFMLTLSLLELNNQELFNKLWLIFPNSIPQNLLIKRLQQTTMKEKVLTLKQFRKKILTMTTR